VTRVAREVGTEGKLGGQADVRGVAGTWKDLTDSVNSMAANLTTQVRNIAEVTTAVAKGDLSRKITVDVRGEILEVKNTVNTMVDQLSSFAAEVTRVAREVGTEGKLGGQADVRGVAGTWKDLTDSVNSMAGNLTAQVRNIAQVTTAVANGDLSRKITVDVQGEIFELKSTINTMVDQLNSFASEVTRVAREVGTEGKLGGQAEVRGVAGTWKDLTDNVNSMAANLTTQVRGIAKVVTDVANGNLKRKLVLETKGEIAELADTINEMIDTLAVFADQVSNVAREVGIEGKLGGQALVPGAAGIWRDLTDNVNQLAANLTTQVRAIADVATAVTKGDLTRSIAVEALGEVAALKDNINEMIVNLAETTRKNTDQDWLKTNIAKFTGMMQGQRDLVTVSRLLLSELTPLVGAQHGTFYITDEEEESLKLLASYASNDRDGVPKHFRKGQGLIGQCGLEKRRNLVTDIPQDYIKISSSLGDATPLSIVVLPVLFEGETRAVIELASFRHFTDVNLAFLDQLTQSIGIVLNTIAATMRTEQLLKKSQALAEQLQKTNAELEEKARLLAEQKNEVETKNREVEQAKAALEEKAEQLSLTSKYKSEFLANMSHELRTPLNNLLILAQMLAENTESTLTSKQVKYAETIHSSGTDLLALINDILDLSKIESGKMDVEIGSVRFSEVRDFCSRTFRHVADGKGLEFSIELADNLPAETIITDAKRLQQVLKNLLSNALKFTENGTVRLQVERASSGWNPNHPVLNRVKSVIAFSVSDTGIGIPQEKQRIIFEAFQQADGTTSRKYGGTGLGLSISRELTRLLGGEVRLQSAPGIGSTFTLYLPQTYVAQIAPAKSDMQRTMQQSAESRAAQAAGDAASLNGSETLDMILAAPSSTPTAVVHDIEIDDDRNMIRPGDPVLLIIEDDVTFARILLDLAHERNIRVLVALRGGTALSLAREFVPGAITLDITLPDMAGWTILDRLKHDPATRHIPVHVITGDENRRRGLALGAMTYLEKSVTKDNLNIAFDTIHHSLEPRTKKLLIVTPDDGRRSHWQQTLGGSGVETIAVGSGGEALAVVKRQYLDAIVLDLRLADISAAQLVEEIQTEISPVPPVVVFGPKRPGAEAEADVRRVARQSVVRYAESQDRLLEETVLLLHRAEPDLSAPQREILKAARQSGSMLAGKKVLVVDDDVRNIFALSTVLEQHGLQVVHAENGRTGIDMLLKTPGIDGVLMDIMMPEMDGYETMRAIRQIPEFRSIPIVAVTAKAMKGDRAKCIDAGASDYITKPVDLEQLFSVLRVWLVRAQESLPAAMTVAG
jgi:signal transduction histidine kinase/DNA-binding response OmpR family regulator/HAMP domain-containing protein